MKTPDETYMMRCLELAQKGKSTVAPNPMVGSVIVHNNIIIGEGFHRKYGDPHAEVNAINSVEYQELLKESTLYVNLEPCAHHGKTPPCSDLIIEKQIPRVVIGCKDSFAKVAGKGIAKMEKAGIDVKVGILENESREINKRFFIFHEHKRPFIVLKWAETIDGYIDVDRNKQNNGISWITHPYLRIPVHKWRNEEAGIIVGTNTARNDNPKLDTRLWYGKNPVRFVLDRNLTLSPTLSLFDGKIPTYVFTEKASENKNNLHYIKVNFSKNLLQQILNKMYEIEIQSVIVEGGRRLLQEFIDLNLWDEARVFTGPAKFGRGIPAPEFLFTPIRQIQAGNSVLEYFHNRLS